MLTDNLKGDNIIIVRKIYKNKYILGGIKDMIKELKNKLNQLEESRKNVDYALDMLECGAGIKSYVSVQDEIDLLIEFNNRLANGILELVDRQEGLDVSLKSILEVALDK